MPLSAALAGDIATVFDVLCNVGVMLPQTLRVQDTAPACEVDVAVGSDAVTLAAPAWRSLQAAGGAATPFQTLGFAERLAEVHLRRGDVPRVVVVREAGRPMVVLPTVVTRWGGLPTVRFLGDPLIQYGDAVAAPDASMAHLEAAWKAAADPAAASFMFLRKVRADARIAPLVARHAVTVGRHEAPYIDTFQPQAANGRDMRELRRFRRRLQERGEVVFRVLQGREAQAAAREAVAIKRAWLAAHGLGSSVIDAADWREAIADLAGAAGSPLRAALLTVGGATAAVEIGFVHDGRWCAFLGAMAPDFAKAGPGQVQMAETVAYCREQGIATYDLLAPADPYKSRIAHGAVPLCDFAVALSAGGRAGLLAARALPALKRLAGRLPAGVLRIVAGRGRD